MPKLVALEALLYIQVLFQFYIIARNDKIEGFDALPSKTLGLSLIVAADFKHGKLPNSLNCRGCLYVIHVLDLLSQGLMVFGQKGWADIPTNQRTIGQVLGRF